MLFEWDEEKAETNLIKHRISFVAATAVFDDPNRIDEDSTKPEYGEVRTKTIGLIEGELIRSGYSHRQRAETADYFSKEGKEK